MKIKDLIAKTPEITEEKLLEIIGDNTRYLRKDTVKEIEKRHITELNKAKLILNEYDLIQDKNSLLTKSRRDEVIGFVSWCMFKMVKGDDGGTTEQPTSKN